MVVLCITKSSSQGYKEKEIEKDSFLSEKDLPNLCTPWIGENEREIKAS